MVNDTLHEKEITHAPQPPSDDDDDDDGNPGCQEEGDPKNKKAALLPEVVPPPLIGFRARMTRLPKDDEDGNNSGGGGDGAARNAPGGRTGAAPPAEGDNESSIDEGRRRRPPNLHLACLQQVLQEAFPKRVVRDATVFQTIVQENAVGFKVRLVLDVIDDDNAEGPSSSSTSAEEATVFVKRVRLSTYIPKKKDWSDLRRTLLYARTEARFYAEVLPQLLRRNHNDHPFAPRVYLSRCDFLDGWIDDDELATNPASSEYPEAYHQWIRRRNIGNDHPGDDPDTDGPNGSGWIVLECVNECAHYQDSPLLPSQSLQCLKAVARLHAAAWQDATLLELCQRRLSRASFHLSMRNPKELEGIVASWNDFYVAFQPHLANEGMTTDAFVHLGPRIVKVARYVSELVSPHATDPYATLIHGDYKALNVFLPRREPSEDNSNEDSCCLMVDFASCGLGLGMSDLAMHVRHAVEPQYLENGGEEALVKQYWVYFRSLLADRNPNMSHYDYGWDVAWRHYKVAVVDYFRFFLGRMWKSATPDTMRAKSANKNVSLINRSVPAAVAFLKNAEAYLTEIEAECDAAMTTTTR